MRRPLLLLLVLLPACSAGPTVVEGRSTVESSSPCVPAPEVPGSAPAGAPALPAGTVVTASGPGTVSGRVAAPLDEVVGQLRASLEAAGYVLTREELEGGRAARLAFFGARGDGTLDVAALRCPPGSTAFTVRVAQAAG